MEGSHYWATGSAGSEADLAGLVCNENGDINCINPLKGIANTGGMTWAQREWELRRLDRKVEIVLEEMEWARNRFKHPPSAA